MTPLAVLGSELGTVLGDRRSIWWHVGILILGPACILLLWPTVSMESFIERGRGPGTLSSLTLAGSATLFVLSGAFTLDRIPREPGHPFLHWLRYTPAAPLSYLCGRLCFHLIHSILLSMMFLPSLMSGVPASLARPGEALLTAAYITLISFCLRAAAEAGRRSDKTSGPLSFLVYILLLLTYLLFSSSSFPDWGLINALRELSEPSLEIGPAALRCAVQFLFFAAVGTGISAWRLFRVERVEKVS